MPTEMITTAQNRVSKRAIVNCFRHSGFFSVDDDDPGVVIYDDDDDIPLIESITFNIREEENWDDFVMVDNFSRVDNFVLTDEERTLKDIVDEIIDSSNNSMEQDIEDGTDGMSEILTKFAYYDIRL